MSRLRKLIAKPRTKKQEVILTVKLNFEAFNDNETEAKADCRRFKDWVKNQFTEWDHSMLQYFLYGYGLVQDSEDSKYLLDMHIDKILKDDSSTLQEQKEFMEEIENTEKEHSEELNDLRKKYENDSEPEEDKEE